MLEDEVGDIISKARRGLGYTPAQLAHFTSMSVSDVEKIESYFLIPEREQINALAESLGLDSEKLAQIALEGWEPPPVSIELERPVVEMIQIPYRGFEENSYIVGCPDTLRAAAVDPGGAPEKILKSLAAHGFSLELVLITHGHGDHTGAYSEIEEAWPNVRVIGHLAELILVPDSGRTRKQPVDDGAVVPLGNLEITVLHTPGHTTGSTSYRVDGVCFTGDTLFAGSIGGPASHAAYPRMLEGIRSRILSLPEDTILLPGHGPPTTVREEKLHNPFF